MQPSDAAFSGSIPALYDRCLGPFLFEPYARDISACAARLRPRRILETAAGTGIVTGALAAAVPDAQILATDLNPAMLDVAAVRPDCGRVVFRVADAGDLPFGDGEFDLVVCQFGAMFFPDRVRAFREARRVLAPGGAFLFNIWDGLEANPAAGEAARAVAALFPEDPPSFLGRVPYGYPPADAEADLGAAGFTRIEGATVAAHGRGRARDVALGLCHGSPLRAEIEARGEATLDEAAAAAEAALIRLCGGESVDAPMSAHRFTAFA